ncbi:MAG: fumarylacetoacetate hydrolase family protein [Bacteroidales bacterium]|nr:fumarylacetoacetate hydrolase family protein [Bacteroidales bacterium]
MKIIAICRNYAAHAAEMATSPNKPAIPSSPAWFLKPDSALLHDDKPFFYPDFSTDVQHEVEVVVRIDHVGKSIEQRFAHRYYSSVALGLDLTARDLQREAKRNGMPWAASKGFDGSAVLSSFVPLDSLGGDIQNLGFSLLRNGQVVQQGNTADMIFPVDQLIQHISQFMTLRTGDLIYTGTPAGVGPIAIGDQLQGILCGQPMFNLRVK